MKSLHESIDQIKSEYPYTVKEILDDSDKLEKKKVELENAWNQCNAIVAEYKRTIELMLR